MEQMQDICKGSVGALSLDGSATRQISRWSIGVCVLNPSKSAFFHALTVSLLPKNHMLFIVSKQCACSRRVHIEDHMNRFEYCHPDNNSDNDSFGSFLSSSWTLLHQNRKLSSRISLQNQLFCLCRLPAVSYWDWEITITNKLILESHVILRFEYCHPDNNSDNDSFGSFLS
jgi:hypothetical protein